MSSSLLKKSLEFVESDTFLKGGRNWKNVASSQPGRVKKNKRGSEKLKKSLGVQGTGFGGKTGTVDDARRKLKCGENRAEEQLRRLLLLNSAADVVDQDTADKIFNHAVKTRKQEKVEEPADETTAFTEADFEKFEKEYFVS